MTKKASKPLKAAALNEALRQLKDSGLIVESPQAAGDLFTDFDAEDGLFSDCDDVDNESEDTEPF